MIEKKEVVLSDEEAPKRIAHYTALGYKLSEKKEVERSVDRRIRYGRAHRTVTETVHETHYVFSRDTEQKGYGRLAELEENADVTLQNIAAEEERIRDVEAKREETKEKWLHILNVAKKAGYVLGVSLALLEILLFSVLFMPFFGGVWDILIPAFIVGIGVLATFLERWLKDKPVKDEPKDKLDALNKKLQAFYDEGKSIVK